MNGSHAQGLTPRILPGWTFDGTPYQIAISSEVPFGHGGSAEIYKGVLVGSNPFVLAVKFFREYGQIEPAVREELLNRELRAARQVSMRHRSILAFLGTAYHGQQQAIVSLYMKNGNLMQYIKANPGTDKKKLILQVADAVNYLHSVERLVHGDLKCENILVSDYGDALLADFGLSRFLELVQSVNTTMTGIRRMYTVRFAAPELLMSDDDTPNTLSNSGESDKPPSKTCESDVYAFGMLVLEAVTEEPPWTSALKSVPRRAHEIAIMERVLKGVHPPQPTGPSGYVSISHLWWNILKNCWSNDSRHRPRMHFVLEALTHSGLEACRLLEGRNFAQGRLLEGHNFAVSSVAYFPDGRRVVSASYDGTIRIWDALTGRTMIGPLRDHDGPVISVAVSPAGRQICSGSEDNTIRRWDAESGEPIGKPMVGHGEVNSVAFSPDGTRIVSGSFDKTVRFWDATTGEALGGPLASHTESVMSVAFSPGGACIASGSSDGAIRLWDSATGADLGVLHHPKTRVRSFCFSPDRIHLISGCEDGSLRVWNVSTRQLARNIKAHSDAINSVAVSPSGRYIASGSNDKSIRIWDAQTGDAVGAPLTDHMHWIFSVAFSPDGRSLVSGSWDSTVRIWDLFE